MDSTLPHVSSLLREIATKECLKSEFRVNTFTEGESGFHGVIQSVELQDDTKIVSLVLKSSPTDTLTRELQKTHDKFVNEVTFYRHIAGKLSDYGRIPRIPQFYGSCLEESQEIIVLEDLRKEGFKMRSLSQGLDSKHLDLVAKSLAKVHRASIKWQNDDPENFNEVVSILKETIFCKRRDPDDVKLTKLLFTQACEISLKCASSDDYELCAEYVNKMIERLDELDSWIKPGDNNAILHGDSWCQNFLFKYDENVSKICFLFST